MKLSLDPSELNSKSGAAGRTLKDLESQGAKTENSVAKLGDTSKSSASSVGELGSAVGKFLAILGGTFAIKAFVSDIIQSSAAIDRLSKNLNVSAGDITAWGNAAEELGGTAAGLQGSLSMLSKAQTQIAITGESSLVPYFNFLGVSLADANGKARNVTDVFKDLAGVAEGKDRPQMHNLFAQMGFDESTINLLLAGRKELDLSLSKQRDYAEQMRKFAPEATKLQHSIVDLKQQFTLLGLSLLQQATPALEKLLSWFEKISGWAQGHQGFILDFLKVMAVGLAALGLAALPLDPLVIAITAVGAAIALLWDDYQTFQKGGQSLIPWDKWKPGIDAAITGIEVLKKIIVTAMQAIVGAVSFAQHAINGDWGGAQKALSSWTEKMNKRWGIGGPDEAHDKSATVANKLVKKIPGALKEVWGSDAPASPGYKTLGEAIGQVEGFNAKGKKPNRPQRNHNPGDIEYGKFAKDHGATGSDGRFAIFPDDDTGKRALYALLQTSSYANLTIPEAIKRFAPPSENNTKGYSDSVLKQTGLSATTTVRQALGGYTQQVAQAGQPGASSSSTTNDNRVSNVVHSVTINAPSGDASGIAQAFRSLNIFPAAIAVVGVR